LGVSDLSLDSIHPTAIARVDPAQNRIQKNPVRTGAEIPLNTLLQAGESVTTTRRFELPADARGIGLMVDRSSTPVCLVIGECEAFHKGTLVRLD
jgi:hypothetical protein